jgi:hypothetical protein
MCIDKCMYVWMHVCMYTLVCVSTSFLNRQPPPVVFSDQEKVHICMSMNMNMYLLMYV